MSLFEDKEWFKKMCLDIKLTRYRLVMVNLILFKDFSEISRAHFLVHL